MEKTIKCADCGKDYTYDEKPGYPRKYCLACSENRKAVFENRGNPAQVSAPAKPALMSAKDVNITAQCLTKILYRNRAKTERSQVLEAYHFFVKSLENDG